MIDTQSECSVTLTAGADGARLHVAGELVATTAAVLEIALDRCLRERPATVAVDLSQVRFMDAAGISALLRHRHRAARHGTHLVVTSLNPFLIRLIRPEVRALLTAAR